MDRYLHRRSAAAVLPRSRTGGAVVELAVCMPLLVLLTLGTVEACGMIFLKQSLKIAAYEASRVAVVDGAQPDNVQAQVDLILHQRNIANYTYTTQPTSLRNLVEGDLLRVTVSAPCAPNSFVGGALFSSKVFNETVQVMVER